MGPGRALLSRRGKGFRRCPWLDALSICARFVQSAATWQATCRRPSRCTTTAADLLQTVAGRVRLGFKFGVGQRGGNLLTPTSPLAMN